MAKILIFRVSGKGWGIWGCGNPEYSPAGFSCAKFGEISMSTQYCNPVSLYYTYYFFQRGRGGRGVGMGGGARGGRPSRGGGRGSKRPGEGAGGPNAKRGADFTQDPSGMQMF